MHELGITQNIIAIAVENADGQPVRRVSLEIGELSAIMPDAVRFCFDVCSKGTLVEGATLEIIVIEGRGRCVACGAEMRMAQYANVCSCGSREIACVAGNELKVRELEVAEQCV